MGLGELLLRLGTAALLGSLIGLERQRHDKVAGLRTHMLVSVGSALIMIVSAYGFDRVIEPGRIVLDPSRGGPGRQWDRFSRCRHDRRQETFPSWSDDGGERLGRCCHRTRRGRSTLPGRDFRRGADAGDPVRRQGPGGPAARTESLATENSNPGRDRAVRRGATRVAIPRGRPGDRRTAGARGQEPGDREIEVACGTAPISAVLRLADELQGLVGRA